MNPSTAFARVLVDELVRGGVTDAVVAPGSRSAPVALALADAEAAGRLRLHVRIDERTAAFLALGLATVALFAADVASQPLLPVDGALPVVRPVPDRLADTAADRATERRWQERLAAVLRS